MQTARKITIQIPEDLLKKAQAATGSGITATIRQGLTRVAASPIYERLRQLRGKVKFSIDWRQLREDRR